MAAKKNLLTALGWLVWKLLASVGLPYAKRRVSSGSRTGGRRGSVRSLFRRH